MYCTYVNKYETQQLTGKLLLYITQSKAMACGAAGIRAIKWYM